MYMSVSFLNCSSSLSWAFDFNLIFRSNPFTSEIYRLFTISYNFANRTFEFRRRYFNHYSHTLNDVLVYPLICSNIKETRQPFPALHI